MAEIACDIIIPVYNAPEELRECVESLLRHTASQHRIVIINDASPDPEVTRYLTTLGAIGHITVIHNQKNLGFVGTVNVGMRESQRDVVLLNSDTIVTSKWLEKMLEAAYSDPWVATVTPYTNNGTICSIPHFNEDNVLPEGFTIESFAEFVEDISEKQFPELPTAVGFCMFIKRSVIEVIGLFDQDTFGRGYGEENDFCCRAIEHGYKNVLADHTFIYHKGSMSFQGAKAKLLHENLNKLNKRYPNYEKSVYDFIHVFNPLRSMQENILYRMQQYKYSSSLNGNILFILHNFFDQAYNHPIGGTEFHVKDLVDNMSDYNAYVMVSNGAEIVIKHYQFGKIVAKYRFGLSTPIQLTHFHHKEYAEILERILITFKIDIVHIHHLFKHSLDAPHVARKLQIPVYMTLHDFFLFCPKVNLLDENHEFCLEKRSEAKCNQCLASTHGFYTNFRTQWKRQMQKLMSQIDVFFTPSVSAQKMFEREYPELTGKIVVMEHGIDARIDFSIKTNDVDPKLKVGFLGGLAPSKGSELIYQVVTKHSKKDIEWHLIGGLGDQRLNLMHQSNVIKHGAYDRNDLSDILDTLDLDIIALWSPWPETYSYTLSEAWIHGIPVLVTPMGALDERVRAVGGGWVADRTDVESITEALDRIKENRYEINLAKDKIKACAFPSKLEVVKKYEAYYFRSMEQVRTHPLDKFSKLSNSEIRKAIMYFKNAVVLDNGTNEYSQQLENELRAIKSTVGYKVLERLRQRNDWILRVGKRSIFYGLKLKKTLRK